MIAYHQPVVIAGPSEMGGASHIGCTRNGLPRCLNANLLNACFQSFCHFTVTCRCKLSGSIYDTGNGIGVSAAAYTVHNNCPYRQLSFIWLIACFTLDQSRQKHIVGSPHRYRAAVLCELRLLGIRFALLLQFFF